VRRPAGSCTRHEHSGGTGAPPGTITSPCQELADDLGVALNTQRPNLKRGPVFAKSPRNEHALTRRGHFAMRSSSAARGSALDKSACWRAERRPPPLPKGDAEHHRFCAFRRAIPSSEGPAL